MYLRCYRDRWRVYACNAIVARGSHDVTFPKRQNRRQQKHVAALLIIAYLRSRVRENKRYDRRRQFVVCDLLLRTIDMTTRDTRTWVVKEVGDLFVSSRLDVTVKGIAHVRHRLGVVMIFRWWCLWETNKQTKRKIKREVRGQEGTIDMWTARVGVLG